MFQKLGKSQRQEYKLPAEGKRRRYGSAAEDEVLLCTILCVSASPGYEGSRDTGLEVRFVAVD
jgi:hypothetical protein